LQVAFQAAFSIRNEFLGLRRFNDGGDEAGEIRANCVSGLLDGGLKGRMQARLPATQRRLMQRYEWPMPTCKVELRSTGQAEACPT